MTINHENTIYSTKVSELNFVDAQPAQKKKTPSSKERRRRYITALERAVNNLQTNSTSLSAQLNQLHEDTNGLISKKRELKLKMESMENAVHLQSVRNDALKKEIEELRAMVRQSIQNSASIMSFKSSSEENTQTQLQNQQFHQHKDTNDFDIGAPMPSQSLADNSSDASSSEDAMAFLYDDYRLF